MSQLRDAGKAAFAMLVQKRVVHQKNVLEEISKDANAPILPGLPSYLPHRWTIDASRNAMLALLREWAESHKGDEAAQERVSDFFWFVVKRMKREERRFKSEMKRTESEVFRGVKEARLVSDIFSPVRKHQTARGLHKFFVDSFAIFIIVRAQGTTSEYAEWFLGEWTPSLHGLWTKKNDEDKKKRDVGI